MENQRKEYNKKGVDIVQPLCYYIGVNNRESKSREVIT